MVRRKVLLFSVVFLGQAAQAAQGALSSGLFGAPGSPPGGEVSLDQAGQRPSSVPTTNVPTTPTGPQQPVQNPSTPTLPQQTPPSPGGDIFGGSAQTSAPSVEDVHHPDNSPQKPDTPPIHNESVNAPASDPFASGGSSSQPPAGQHAAGAPLDMHATDQKNGSDNHGPVTSGFGFEDKENQDVIDTVDVKSTSGNWVFKNYWWRKIEELYSQIKDAFNKVMSSRITFFSKRSDIDKELDRFYQHVGLEQGPLEDIINLSLEVIEKEKKEQGNLSKKEQAFYDKVKNKQHQLEQLKADVKAIQELDAKIDEALEVVLKQVDVCSKYEQEAYTTFKNVARELSDKEARKQYYDTKGLLDDINKVHQYLTGPFTGYFQQMVQGVQEHTQSISSKLSALKSDEVDLKKEADFFEQEEDDTHEVPNKHDDNKDPQKTTDKPKTVKPEKDILSRIVDGITHPVETVRYWVNQLVSKIASFFSWAQEGVVSGAKDVKEDLSEKPTQEKKKDQK